MICPFAGLLGIGAVASGSQRLLVRDVRYRAYSWLATVLLGLSWVAYFLAVRRPEVRVMLEVVSVVLLVAAGIRLRTLVRSGLVAPLSAGVLGRIARAAGDAVRSPWVAGVKGVLLAMVTIQALGRATFSGIEYGAVVVLLLGLGGARLLRRPATNRFGSLARFGAEAPPASCPLGFGCATPAHVTSARDAHAKGEGQGFAPGDAVEGWNS